VKQDQKTEPPQTPKPKGDRMKVKIRLVSGGELTDGEFDPTLGLIYTRKAAKDVILSIHCGLVHWISAV
jgi:hypothetical protein